MEVSVREATVADIPWLIEQLKEFSVFYDPKLSFFGDEEYVVSGIEVLIKEHVFLIAVKGTVRLGFVAGILSGHMYNPRIKVLNESLWWVEKKFRNGKAAFMLLETFIERGKKEKADLVHFVLSGKNRIKDKALLKRGFYLNERIYTKEMK